MTAPDHRRRRQETSCIDGGIHTWVFALVYIEVPNMLKPYGTKCAFTFEHVNYFTPTSLANLVQQGGFEVDSLHTFDNGKDVNPGHSVIARTIRKTKESFAIKDDAQEGIRAVEEY